MSTAITISVGRRGTANARPANGWFVA